jgi:hypothetical protein
MGSKSESLIFRERVHPSVMKDGQKRDGSAAGRIGRHMILGERSDILSFCEPLCALTNISQRADVLIREFAIQYEAAQSIALPGRTVMRPFKYFL